MTGSYASYTTLLPPRRCCRCGAAMIVCGALLGHGKWLCERCVEVVVEEASRQPPDERPPKWTRVRPWWNER